MPSFVEIGPLVLEKKIFEGFLPYMGMAAILEEMMFEYYGTFFYNVQVYCPGVGADEPLGSIFFRIINIQFYCPFPARFSL